MAMTMLQMAGATPTPATMADGVLLIIDAQREYTDGLLPLPGVQPAIDALAGLLDKARKAGAPIVHVRHKSAGKAFNPSSSGYEIVAPLAPRAGETIVDKGLPNAFAGTDLAKHLTASGRKNLIVGGFMTHMCVSATVRCATDNGFMSTIAADTVATRDLPDATGGATVTRRRHQPHHAGGPVRSFRVDRSKGGADPLSRTRSSRPERAPVSPRKWCRRRAGGSRRRSRCRHAPAA